MSETLEDPIFAKDWFPFHAASPEPQALRAAFQAYADAITAGDFEAIAACFTPDGVMEDPVGSTPIEGREAIKAFFKAGQEMAGGSFRFSLGSPIRVAGRTAAATTLTETPIFKVESIGFLEFDENGLIVRLKAIYGVANVHPLNG